MSSIAIVGFSGEGKSTSYGKNKDLGIEGLNPKETIVVNVTGKDLPFRKWQADYKGKVSEGGNYLESNDADVISKTIDYVSTNRPDIKNMVIDDSQYIMGFEFMRRAKENGYMKFSDIGQNMNKVLMSAKNTRRDLKIFFMWHPEVDNRGNMKIKTIGKMLDEYLTIEGLFTVVLYANVEKGSDDKTKYQFVTNNDGVKPAKSPSGMFTDLYIPNDLGLVVKKIDEYNN